MRLLSVKWVSHISALILGSGLSSVYALTETDFTNTGVVLSASAQYENNSSNNNSAVLVQPKGMTVQKLADTAGLSSPTQAGDIIEYEIVIENIGLLGISSVALDDAIIASENIELASGDANDNGIVDADEIWRYAASYSITQADIDSFGDGDGLIDNTVTVNSEQLDPIQASVSVPIVQAPSYSVSKTVDSNTVQTPGVLNYVISVSNTGNTSLEQIVVEDTLPDGSTVTPNGPTNDTGLALMLDVGETWEFTQAYLVSQAEIDLAADITNSASVSTKQTGTQIISDTATTSVISEPAIAVFKQVDMASISAPEQLNYSITVKNQGNVSLNNIELVDVLPNGSNAVLEGPTDDIGDIGVLDVGESWSYSTQYMATQADIDAGVTLTNSVSANADETTVAAVDTASTDIQWLPAMEVSKRVDIPSIAEPTLLQYEISVVNTGNNSLSDINIVDILPDGTTAVLVGPLDDVGIENQIDVGETWVYTTSYSVSQAEIDAGLTRVNKVDVLSKQTEGTAFTASAVTTISQSPSFLVTKTADKTVLDAPDTVVYTISVENRGNVSLSGIELFDTLPDGSAAVLNGPVNDSGANALIDVGETWVYSTSYDVSQQEIDAGVALVNNVRVISNEAGSEEASATTVLSQNPAISLSKTSEQTSFLAANDVIDYRFTVLNSGNVLLHSVMLEDPLVDPSSLSCAPALPSSLQPGESMSCSATKTVIQDDVLNTSIVNVATVTGIDTNEEIVTHSNEPHTLELTRMPPVAIDDIKISEQSQVIVTLAGATNDTDENNDIVLASVHLSHPDALDTDNDGDNDLLLVNGEGEWQVNNNTGEVSFSPLPGFTADPTPISYQISDSTSLSSELANLVVDYPQMAPTAKDDYVVNDMVASAQNTTSVAVLANNGSGEDTDPENDINIKSVNFKNDNAIDTDGDGDRDELAVASEGVWTIDNDTAVVTFTPLSGFLEDPTPVSYTISDTNGLESNAAKISIDYPQRAPVAVNDKLSEQTLAQTIQFNVLANDTDADNNIDPSSVALIDALSGERVSQLSIEGEGLWRVDATNGYIAFIPEEGFVSDPAIVHYTVHDTTGLESNQASITLDYEEPITLEGIVWLDSNRDGVVDDNEQRKPGWTLRIRDVNGNIVAEVVTDENGEYRVTGLVSGIYSIDFYNEHGVYMDSQSTDGIVKAGETLNLPLAVDPGGVVYDSVTRAPIAGVTLNILNAQDQLLHVDCLAPNQQSQVTTEDGLYAFNVSPGAHETCPSSASFYLQVVSAPEQYHPAFSSLIRQQGAQQCGSAELGCAVSGVFDTAQQENNCTVDSIPDTNACEVQLQPDAPSEQDDTRYYVEFFIQPGDRAVIFNHLPLDAVANDAQVLLTKTANKKDVSVGDVLQYTIFVENTKDVPAVDLQITDKPAAGFSFVEQAVSLNRIGADGAWGTSDDVIEVLGFANNDVITLEKFDLAAQEQARIQYIMRVGPGVVSGTYANKAFADGNTGVVSNTVSATVNVVPDPVLGQATLIGKVFHDRDGDGTQDSANATGVKLNSAYYHERGLALPDLPGRTSVSQDPAQGQVVVNMPVTGNNRFSISTKQGTRISIDEDGTIFEAHVGDKARGFNSQDIRVCTTRTTDFATAKTGKLTTHGDAIDVVKIHLSNFGLSEQGIPGVRLATVSGLLIETDAYGRYSIPDIEAGDGIIGRNFVLKVDRSTLPEGAQFTTENPYVLRIMKNALNKINFGVKIQEDDSFASDKTSHCANNESQSLAQSIEVSLGPVFFDVDQHTVRKDQQGIVQDIVSKLREFGGGRIVINAHTDSDGSAGYNLKLAERRAKSMATLLREALGERLMEGVTVEVDPNAYKEQSR